MLTLKIEITVKLNSLLHPSLPLPPPDITAHTLPPPVITAELL